MVRPTCDRKNTSTEANIDKTAIIGSGSFKNVFGGLYAEGPRLDEFCIAKVRKLIPSRRIRSRPF